MILVELLEPSLPFEETSRSRQFACLGSMKPRTYKLALIEVGGERSKPKLLPVLPYKNVSCRQVRLLAARGAN